MDSRAIERHNFEQAKQKLERLMESAGVSFVDTSVPIEKDVTEWFSEFFTGGGIGIDHKVTGAELNAFQANIKNSLASIARSETNIIKQLSEVYKAFDALDKDYIKHILISLATAQQGVEEARTAQHNTDEATKRLTEAVDALLDFQSEVCSNKHISDVDAMYDTVSAVKEQVMEHGGMLQKQQYEIQRLSKEMRRVNWKRSLSFRP